MLREALFGIVCSFQIYFRRRFHSTSRNRFIFLRDWTETIQTFYKQNQLGARIFLICLLFFSTCFGQLCVHYEEKIPYLCDTWYLLLYIDDWYAGRNFALRTTQSSVPYLCDTWYLSLYTGCNRRNGPDFGRVFVMLNYTEKPQNTYIQS